MLERQGCGLTYWSYSPFLEGCIHPQTLINTGGEAGAGIEPADRGFADPSPIPAYLSEEPGVLFFTTRFAHPLHVQKSAEKRFFSDPVWSVLVSPSAPFFRDVESLKSAFCSAYHQASATARMKSRRHHNALRQPQEFAEAQGSSWYWSIVPASNLGSEKLPLSNKKAD